LQLRKTHDLPLIGTIFPFGLEALLRPHKFLQIDEILPHAFLQDLPRVVAHLRFLWEFAEVRDRLFQSTSVQLWIAVLGRRQQLRDFTTRPVIDRRFLGISARRQASLASVTTWRTRSGARRAISRAKTPPRDHPIRVTLR